MSTPRTVIVTGANRGIGKAICTLILKDTSLTPLELIATSRGGKEIGFPTSKDQKIHYQDLDISQSSSISSFATSLKSQDRKVDVLINNAGVNLDDEFSPENAKRTLDINYRGTLQMCQSILPLMKPQGRIVNLSSVGSSLKAWSPSLGSQIRKISTLSSLEDLASTYLSHVSSNTDSSSGFPTTRAYSVSKAFVNLLTKILASQNPDVVINCCCPGWIDTEMGALVARGRTRPPKSAEQGARIPVKLAFGDLGGVSGRYWANDSVRSKEEGRVQDW